ncbi:hypothetical protein Tco_0586103 [Tanacetum coccineum]
MDCRRSEKNIISTVCVGNLSSSTKFCYGVLVPLQSSSDVVTYVLNILCQATTTKWYGRKAKLDINGDAIKSEKSEMWIDALKEELKLMARNKVRDLINLPEVSSFALVVFHKLLPSPELFPKSTRSKLLPKTQNFRHEREPIERLHHQLSLLLHYFPPEEKGNSEAKETTDGEPAP